MNEKDMTEVRLSGEKIFDGRVIRVERDTVRLPDGARATREVVRHPGAVCVVPLTDKNEVLLVRQYRYPEATVMTEIPAGKLEPGEHTEEHFADAARREGISPNTLRMARKMGWTRVGRHGVSFG